MSAAKKTQNIKTFLRIRPYMKQEKQGHDSIRVCGAKEVAVKCHDEKKYVADGILPQTATQENVYEMVVSPMLSDVLSGYNCTLYAYGQTGSGKSYTLNGEPDLQNPSESGMIVRFLRGLLEEMQLHRVEFTLRVSCIMLYNEEIIDLLSLRPIQDTSVKIRLYEDQRQKGSVVVHGIEESIVRGNSDIYAALKKANARKLDVENALKIQSNRAHNIFIAKLHVRQVNEEGVDVMKIGKMTFVDLAGSEASKTGNDKKSRESNSIYTSVLTLGRIITALNEKSSHVPYRESKLTRMLQDSLGGHNITTFLATLSPTASCLEETINTLDYVSKVRNIINKPEINKQLPKETLVQQCNNEIVKLRKELQNALNGDSIYLDEAKYESMVSEIEENKEIISSRILYKREVEQRIKDLEKEQEDISVIFAECDRSIETLESEVENKKQLLKAAEEAVEENKTKINKIILKQQSVKDQALVLMNVTESTLGSEHLLHEKLTTLHIASEKNEELLNHYLKNMETQFDKYYTKLLDVGVQFNAYYSDMICLISDKLASFQKAIQSFKESLLSFQEKLNKMRKAMPEPPHNSEEQSELNIELTNKFCAEMKEKFLDSFKNDFQPMVLRLRDFMNDNLETNTKILEQLAFIMDYCSKMNKEMDEEYFKLADESMVQEIEEQIVANCKDLQQSANLQLQMQEKITYKLDMISQLLEEIQISSSAQMDTVMTTCTKYISGSKNMVKYTEKLCKTINGSLNALEEKENALKQFTSQKINDVTEDIQNQTQKNTDTKEVLQNATLTMKDSLNNQRSIGEVETKALSSYLGTNVEKAAEHMDKYIEEIDTLKADSEELQATSEDVDKAEKEISVCANDYKSFVNDRLASVDTLFTNFEKEMVNMEEQIFNITEDVDKMFIRVVHKGDTPVRKPKSYPHKININTPKRLYSMAEQEENTDP